MEGWKEKRRSDEGARREVTKQRSDKGAADAFCVRADCLPGMLTVRPLDSRFGGNDGRAGDGPGARLRQGDDPSTSARPTRCARWPWHPASPPPPLRHFVTLLHPTPSSGRTRSSSSRTPRRAARPRLPDRRIGRTLPSPRRCPAPASVPRQGLRDGHRSSAG